MTSPNRTINDWVNQVKPTSDPSEAGCSGHNEDPINRRPDAWHPYDTLPLHIFPTHVGQHEQRDFSRHGRSTASTFQTSSYENSEERRTDDNSYKSRRSISQDRRDKTRDKFEKRPRYKTKESRYATTRIHNRKKQARETYKNAGRHKLRSSRDVLTNFTCRDIPNKRITVSGIAQA